MCCNTFIKNIGMSIMGKKANHKYPYRKYPYVELIKSPNKCKKT